MHAGGLHHVARLVRCISSRGARVRKDPGVSLSDGIKRLVEHPRKTRDDHRSRPVSLQLLDTGVAGRPAGQNVINQNDIFSRDHGLRFRCHHDGTSEDLFTLPGAHSTKARRLLAAFQPIHKQSAMSQRLKFSPQHRRLIEATLPQSPAMERDGYDQPLRVSWRQTRANQPRQHRRQANPASVFECEDKLARCIGIERARGNSVMDRRIAHARCANGPSFRAALTKRALA